MEAKIHAIHFDASDQLQAFIAKKTAKLEKFSEEIGKVEVSLKVVKPETAMNRGMLVTVLWRAEGSPEPKGTTPFTDLKQNYYKKAVAWAKSFCEKSDTARACRVLDIGCGSGAIGVSLAKLVPAASVTCTDISPAALEIARQNAARLSVEVEFLEGDLLAPVEGRKFVSKEMCCHSFISQILLHNLERPVLVKYAEDKSTGDCSGAKNVALCIHVANASNRYFLIMNGIGECL